MITIVGCLATLLSISCSALLHVSAFSVPPSRHQHHQHFQTSSRWVNNKHVSSSILSSTPPMATTSSCLFQQQNKDQRSTGEVGSGPNWIERSFPVETTDETSVDPKKVDDYNLGISGISYDTGPLSKRMHDAMTRTSSISNASPEVQQGFLIYAMDFTAKEAVRAALQENGLELVLTDDEQDEGMWGDVDSIRLLSDDDNDESISSTSSTRIYDSWQEAIQDGGWTPGQAFSFVVRQVPAKMRELTLDELLQALDPKGELRQQAQDKGMYMPDITSIRSLHDMANENVRRTEVAPREVATTEQDAFSGLEENRGYQVVQVHDLVAATAAAASSDIDETAAAKKTMLHVMDALVSHGCLIVDLTNGEKDMENAKTMAAMWKTVEDFYDHVDQFEDSSSTNNEKNDMQALLSGGMRTVLETGSPHAKVGFASYDNGNLQFLETRLDRQGNLWPHEAQSVLKNNDDDSDEDGSSFLKAAFDVVANVSKNIVRLAVAASTMEAASNTNNADEMRLQAFEAAELLSNELVDDAKPLASNDIEHAEASVSMSPHRLCRYSNKQQQQQPASEENNSNKSKKKQKKETTSPLTREIFGAHTDSTFITAVPVAAVSGLEVYDEDAEKWYRPELMAYKHYHDDVVDKGGHDEHGDGSSSSNSIPWYARYLVCMPGELLQLATRNEIMAAVHRVVATQNGPSRLSAPILLRGRPGTRMNVNRYLLQDEIMKMNIKNEGDDDDDDARSLLEECNGMTIEQIHDAMQPTSFE